MTQEILALTLERIVETGESLLVGYNKIKEQIRENEYALKTGVKDRHYDCADNTAAYQDMIKLEREGWYYYHFDTDQLYCLSDLKGDPRIIYDRPKEYSACSWKSIVEDPFHIRIVAFDMEHNLMWVSVKDDKDKRYWMPLNISADMDNRLRPDLPVWQEPSDDLHKSNSYRWNKELAIYFDGTYCYLADKDGFRSIDPTGKVEQWPIGGYGDLVVKEGYVYYSGRLTGDVSKIKGYSSEYPQQDATWPVGFYYPSSHKFQGITGYAYFTNPAWTSGVAHGWMIQAFEQGEKADSEAYRIYQEEQERKKEQEQETQKDQGDILENLEWETDNPAVEEENREEEPDEQNDWSKVLDELDAEENRTDWDSDEAETDGASGLDITTPATQLAYWEGFSSYADSFGLNPALKMAKLADRTWQALRMKPSFVRIECSFSVRKNSIRTAFIVEGHPEVFARVEKVRGEIDGKLQGYDIAWDGESSAANISLTTSREGMSTSEQYDWFCRAVEALYDAVRPRLGV